MALQPLDQLRDRLGRSLFAKVAGAEGPARRDRIHNAPGPRWFDPDRPIRRVHADASMFVGGLGALLLQSLHPLAMTAMEAHSGYRGDPWGRLQRTSTFLATTTFGAAEDAEAAVAQVRAIHARVRGTTPDGRPYAASDPRLLEWIHLAEIATFLRAHQRYGSDPLDRAGRDGYVADTARVARRLGVLDPPTTEADMLQRLEDFRPELQGTPQARAAARFLLVHPPLSAAARPAYAVLSAAAVGLLPRWARRPLRLPYLPVVEGTVVRASGQALTAGIRFVMSAPHSAGEPNGSSEPVS